MEKGIEIEIKAWTCFALRLVFAYNSSRPLLLLLSLCYTELEYTFMGTAMWIFD